MQAWAHMVGMDANVEPFSESTFRSAQRGPYSLPANLEAHTEKLT